MFATMYCGSLECDTRVCDSLCYNVIIIYSIADAIKGVYHFESTPYIRQCRDNMWDYRLNYNKCIRAEHCKTQLRKYAPKDRDRLDADYR